MAPLIEAATLPDDVKRSIRETAGLLVRALRSNRRRSGVERLVQEYALSSQEGVALMCLAEALLRIPDNDTRDALIRDKVATGDWQAHLGGDKPLFVNAATWGLVITGKLVGSVDDRGLGAALSRLVARAGEPMIRSAVDIAMRMMGEQFVAGETIGAAMRHARKMEAKGFRYSYDMLGEAAATAEDARRFYKDYEAAIHVIGRSARGADVYERAGISVKLSALHPRYSRSQADRVMQELLPRVQKLAVLARGYDIGFNIDAEEQDRLELSLDILESLALDPALAGWSGLGFVVQAYGKRCPFVLDWIIDLARRAKRRIMVRLVKGAYWDAEIKRAQVDGLADFPVYTRKHHSDIAYIACARQLLAAPDALFPQFATHNAQTVATIYHLAGPDFANSRYEFQCLHGMGEPLYEHILSPPFARPCRIYAPVGTHETLLAYLVRRLLENGANSSFVNRIGDESVPVEALIVDPVDAVAATGQAGAPHDLIRLPAQIFPDRRNSAGLDLGDEEVLAGLAAVLRQSSQVEWRSEPPSGTGAEQRVSNPADHADAVGTVRHADAQEVRAATARAADCEWGHIPVADRAAILDQAADIMQERMPVLLGLVSREGGKTLPNAIGEVREAVDFLRYYAQQARTELAPDQKPLGPAVCISPWNFPLSIFTGQVAAALVAGNPVLAKPAEETPLIAAEAVRILHQAGVPRDALQLLPGDGRVGAALVGAPETSAVLFTGSTEVARLIQKQLSDGLLPSGRPIPLIAETGGQNAMIVDSSALAEQVVADVMASAFDSAGQRCSALRILCLQEEVADRILNMLRGALAELHIGRPDRLCVDIGPIISKEARDNINRHVQQMREQGCHIDQIALPSETERGTFVAPTIIEIEAISDLKREIFGPVLHVVRYRREDLDKLVDAINETGYGLTFGLHTRLDAVVDQVTRRVAVGNIYVNRNIIGATVGVQPFGGRGLSGTGPKAGGPLYLGRLVAQPPVHVWPTKPVPEALAAFIQWLEARGEKAAAVAARHYGAISGLGVTVALPGPVGERNEYSLHPRGTILLHPASSAGLYDQIAATLATGNIGALDGVDLPDDLPPPVVARLRSDKGEDISAALVEGDPAAVTALTKRLADRAGALVPVHAAAQGEVGTYPIDFLLEERAVCTNTTAAGGNASLMAMG